MSVSAATKAIIQKDVQAAHQAHSNKADEIAKTQLADFRKDLERVTWVPPITKSIDKMKQRLERVAYQQSYEPIGGKDLPNEPIYFKEVKLPGLTLTVYQTIE